MIIVLLIIIGIALMMIGTIIFINKIKLLRDGVKTEGEVIDLQKYTEASISEGKQVFYVTIYKPVIQFKTESGEIKRIIYENVEDNKMYNIGDKVKLIYPAKELDKIEIQEKSLMINFLCKLITIGIVIIVLALVLLLV